MVECLVEQIIMFLLHLNEQSAAAAANSGTFLYRHREECNLFTVGLLHDFKSRSICDGIFFRCIAVVVGAVGVVRYTNMEFFEFHQKKCVCTQNSRLHALNYAEILYDFYFILAFQIECTDIEKTW